MPACRPYSLLSFRSQSAETISMQIGTKATYFNVVKLIVTGTLNSEYK